MTLHLSSLCYDLAIITRDSYICLKFHYYFCYVYPTNSLDSVKYLIRSGIHLTSPDWWLFYQEWDIQSWTYDGQRPVEHYWYLLKWSKPTFPSRDVVFSNISKRSKRKRNRAERCYKDADYVGDRGWAVLWWFSWRKRLIFVDTILIRIRSGRASQEGHDIPWWHGCYISDAARKVSYIDRFISPEVGLWLDFHCFPSKT